MTTIVYLLIALVAAKLAAELSEQIKVPAVVGEIVAGLIIGPSALGWLPANETLTIMGGDRRDPAAVRCRPGDGHR